jgi:hypothetical protein
MCQFYSDSSRFFCNQLYVLSRAINFGRQCHFKIWLDCQQSAKKNEKKFTINVIQRDDRL